MSSETPVVLVVSKKEFDFLLAAANLWLSPEGAAAINNDLLDVATCGGEHDEFTMDEIDTLCERINSTKPLIWSGFYEHRHGNDLSLYASREAAYAARDAVGEDQWDKEGIPFDKPETDVGAAYFEYMGQRDRAEFFTVESHEVHS